VAAKAYDAAAVGGLRDHLLLRPDDNCPVSAAVGAGTKSAKLLLRISLVDFCFLHRLAGLQMVLLCRDLDGIGTCRVNQPLPIVSQNFPDYVNR
jgi:hypothetical protein